MIKEIVYRFLYDFAPFCMVLYFFGRYVAKKNPWYTVCGGTMLWCWLYSIFEAYLVLFLPFLCGFLFLFGYGCAVLKCGWKQAMSISALLISILYFANTITGTIIYIFITQLPQQAEKLEIFFALMPLLFMAAAFTAILRVFFHNHRLTARSILSFPLLFIGFTEQVVLYCVYGDTIVWNAETGLVYPLVSSTEILGLQIVACIALASLLAAYCYLEKAAQTEQANQLFALQTKEQTAHLQQVQLHQQQMRAFRHDIRNHLLMLHGLLQKNEISRAMAYLSELEMVSDALADPFHTGNPAVDALLSSKFSAAAQQNITITCQMQIPSDSQIADIDWCIILSNAVDNAIKACGNLPNAQKQIVLKGKRQGKFFLLSIENFCPEGQDNFCEGIGISNIRAVINRYGGTLEIGIQDGKFMLDALLCISHQQAGI